MLKGVLDLKAIIFFFSVIAFSFFLTHRAVEAQRWAQ
jgi:ABC-2 type transport system permease protein